MTGRIAVVGAGLAGLTCARALVRAGRSVVVYEKSRGTGGRMATRRDGAVSFDHGAQYFTVRDPGFATEIEELEQGGIVARWEPRWPADTREPTAMRVGVPGMSSLGRHFAMGLDVRLATRIVAIERTAQGWRLVDELDSITERYAAVVLAMPAPQAAEIAQVVPTVAERLRAVTMAPCWAVVAAWDAALPVELDADWRPDPVLPWIARNRSKRGRTGLDAWVLHASAEWSTAHLEDAPGKVVDALLAAFPARLAAVAKLPDGVPSPVLALAHRWRHARVEKTLGEDALWEPALGLGACGDWCVDARVEAAWLSGRAMAARLEGWRG